MDHAVVELIIVTVVNLGAVLISYGALRQEVRDMKENQTDRHAENGRRFDRIERAVGISNGADTGQFVPRRECYLMEKAVQQELEGIKGRLDDIEKTLEGLRP